MDSYFFIPGNLIGNIHSIQEMNVTEIIIDVEDSVKNSERENIIGNIISNRDDLNKFYIRIPLHNPFTDDLDLAILSSFIENGFTKFIFPKIESKEEFDEIALLLNEKIKIIFLVETPGFLFDLREVLIKYRPLITGVALGSHDFVSIVGGVHTLKNLEYVRQQILYLARSVDIHAIDIASMELKNSDGLTSEIMDGFEMGYDAKFLIHPWQIEVLRRVDFYTEKEHEWALRIQTELNKVKDEEDFNPIILDGQVVEKPHINKVIKILKYFKNESK